MYFVFKVLLNPIPLTNVYLVVISIYYIISQILYPMYYMQKKIIVEPRRCRKLQTSLFHLNYLLATDFCLIDIYIYIYTADIYAAVFGLDRCFCLGAFDV